VTTSDAALPAVERVVGDGGDSDDVLRGVVQALVDCGAASWAAILFAERGELELGPEAGTPNPALATRIQVPVTFGDTHVAELAAEGCDNRGLLEHVAALLSEHCLVGWDTGGVPWDDAG
jgi:hypothetical protein